MQRLSTENGEVPPQNGIEIANLLHHALLAVDDDQYRVAIPQLERVLKAEPSLAVANQEMGRALNGLEKYAEAIPYLQKAVELNPQSGRAHLELGTALGSTGNWAGSAKQFEAAVSRVPESDDLHFFLGVAYDNPNIRCGRPSREMQKINPNRALRQPLLGGCLVCRTILLRHCHFCKGCQMQPQSQDAHAFLANVISSWGRPKSAARKAEAEHLGAAGRR